MAGFLIVEGDVDDYLISQIEEYNERLIMYQFEQLGVAESEGRGNQKKAGGTVTVNRVLLTTTNPLNMIMRPSAIERWRLLNALGDGRGFIEFMVVEAIPQGDNVYTVTTNAQPMDLLAYDGITLVDENGLYTTSPDVTSTKLAPANRADFLFQSPALHDNGEPRVFVLLAKANETTSDGGSKVADQVIATLIVKSEPIEQSLVDVREGLPLNTHVPNAIQPINDENELKLTVAEVNVRLDTTTDMYRTRVITYSGWGNASYPFAGDVPKDYNSMAINGEKFNPDGYTPLMGLARDNRRMDPLESLDHLF